MAINSFEQKVYENTSANVRYVNDKDHNEGNIKLGREHDSDCGIH